MPRPRAFLALALHWPLRGKGSAALSRARERRTRFLRQAKFAFPFHTNHPLVVSSEDVATGVLLDAGDLPILVREVESTDPAARVTWGIGIADGRGESDLTRSLLFAYEALDTAIANHLPLAAAGDDIPLARLVGGIGVAVLRHRRQFTRPRRRIAELLDSESEPGASSGRTQGAVARELSVRKQYVSQELRRMDWKAYRASELAWREALVVAGVIALS